MLNSNFIFSILFFKILLYIINLYGTSDMTKIEDDFDEEYNKKLRNEKLSISQFIYSIFNDKTILMRKNMINLIIF